VPVEPVRGVKWKEARYPHDDGTQNRIPDVEIVVREAAPLVRQDAILAVRLINRETVSDIPKHSVRFMHRLLKTAVSHVESRHLDPRISNGTSQITEE
jgi:hypothetical protein